MSAVSAVGAASALDRWSERIDRAVVATAALCLVVSVVTVVANVVMRYVVHVSLPWSAELARYAMVWSAALGASVLVNRDEHLFVDVLDRALSLDAGRRLRRVVLMLSMAFYAILFVSGWQLVQRTRGQVASSLGALPMSAVYAVVPVAALLMLWGACATWLRLDRAGPAAMPDDATPSAPAVLPP